MDYKPNTTMKILKSHSVMAPRANYPKTAVFIAIAAITALFTGIYALKS
jgi:hypothetical protein